MSDELIYRAENFPHGLRCIDCDHLFEEGERYARRLDTMTEFMGDTAFVSEIVCVPCDLRAAVR